MVLIIATIPALIGSGSSGRGTVNANKGRLFRKALEVLPVIGAGRQQGVYLDP
jgi:hypothetical protein